MKRSFVIVLVGSLLLSNVLQAADDQPEPGEYVLADFEGKQPVATTYSSHQASITAVKDVPEGGGKFAAQTVSDAEAGATSYLGTGFAVPITNLSRATEIRFWIKTDIASAFNFQVHSDASRASVFQFSTLDSKPGEWMQVKAPVAAFKMPPWAEGEADWERISNLQVTAFGGGPYDAKTIILDHVVSAGQHTDPAPPQRGGPIHLKHAKTPTVAKSPPQGFRSLFDGKTLDGWQAQARLPVPPYPGGPFKWRLEGERLEAAKKNTGRWKIEEGAIVGGQEPPGSGKGAYLVSEETFGDFELIMDMKPDWKTDSGFLIRTLPGGSPGMQVLVDHRPQGGIGGFYGNGLAGVHGMPFAIDAEYDKKGNPIRMIAADPEDDRVELNPQTRAILEYGAEVEDFLKVWNFGQWNTIKVRCEGRIPTLTTWVNGLKIAVLDMQAIEWKNYDAEACAKLQGGKGHISLEVHDNNFNHWLGKDRWWPGAVVRWKNIYVRELDKSE